MNFNLQSCYLSFLILITISQIMLEATCKEFCTALAFEKRIRPFRVLIIQSQGWKIHYHICKPLSYVYIGWDISGISQLNYYIVFHLGLNIGEYLTSNHKEIRELWLFTVIRFQSKITNQLFLWLNLEKVKLFNWTWKLDLLDLLGDQDIAGL